MDIGEEIRVIEVTEPGLEPVETDEEPIRIDFPEPDRPRRAE